MTIARPGFERRVLSALDARPARIPVLVGGCGTGRTFLLRRLRERLGPSGLPVHRHRAFGHHARAPAAHGADGLALHRRRTCPPTRGRHARPFDSLVAFFQGARSRSGAPVTFLLDEALEFRTFENFPRLRHVFHDLIAGLSGIDQPLRPDDALHHAGAAVRPRSAEPRGDPPDAAHDRRAARDHRARA
jgi:hypothetical protein